MGRRRPPALPLNSLGWSLAGALALALSLPPLGVYPLAWVGLVPLLVRWSARRPSWAYARELYAVLLAASCCVGFWVLFNPDPGTAALGGATLFLVPVPLTAAFVASGAVRHRHGLGAGLVALALYVIAAEFLLLQTSVTLPWLLLGHTQVAGLEFIQIADLGGVSLLSLWVLALNGAAFLALPRAGRAGERGVAVAAFATLVAVPVVYGAVRTAQSDVPKGYTRVGVVQPGLSPRAWAEAPAEDRVELLARASDAFLARWRADAAAPDSAAPPDPAPPDPDAVRPDGLRASGYGLLVWPRASLPRPGSAAEAAALFETLDRWAGRRDLSLLAGARLPAGDDGEAASAAVLVRPGAPAATYLQMRRVSFADAAGVTGDRRALLDTGGARVAAAVGFESVFGDHVRRFTRDGADLVVVLARHDLWGRSAGLDQHLLFTRLRAVESRRSVVLSTVSGGSAVIQPGGAVTEVAGWMEPDVASVDVPLFRGQTFYVRHGDWLGRWALGLALALSVAAVAVGRYAPRPAPKRRKLAPA
ncbi:nitrilase-related carbon-nitrogen hydrolase [Rubrivirga sp. S365]|uniref:apolipoprotein N-acyltransferase n=1 Tax=Rubrivirga sp. S365 TaxID=3076080 RepID=UPI0028C54319|nr:nitrilase-related carbon-nitrogen hydrolase [Rubrivirga sp. S365]MDT7856987.1 nitrilase-related carbon-nitrogen hydrolase [Rubrivirga sp. S365]